MNLERLFADYRRGVATACSASGRPAPDGLLRIVWSRSRHGIGPYFFALYDLARTPRARWRDYVIDERLKPIQRTLNPPAARTLVGDKLAFSRHCHAHGLPTIPVVIAIEPRAAADEVNGKAESVFVRRIQDAPDRLFFKLIDGTWGIDAFIARRAEGSEWHFDGQIGSPRDLHAFCLQRLADRRGWLVQPVLQPHRALQRSLSPKALGTVRAVSYASGGEVQLLFAVLRIPVGRNVTDNFSHGASGNLVAPVSIDDGRVGVGRGSRSPAWPDIVDVDRHPDTGHPIAGFALPFWEETRTLVRRAHLSMPELCTIGWDIAITDDGPVIVEGNATYDTDLVQVAHKRGVRPDLKAVGLMPH